MKLPTHLDVAKQYMPALGRFMIREHYGDFWEDETMTLPWMLRRARRKYKAFADRHIRPVALQADIDPSSIDKDAIIKEYAEAGMSVELLPAPIGTMNPVNIMRYGFDYALKVEELTAACGGIALMLLAHDLGFAPLILSGHLTTHLRWTMPIARKLRRGERYVMAFAITEPGAGSDVEDTEGAMKAKVVTRARKVDGGYSITGRKVFISDGGIADAVTVFACLGDEGLDSWTCFLVERGTEGFTTGRKEKKMGQKAGDATELIFEDVFVPDKNMIGPERSGWALNRAVLNFSRPFVGCIALGIARGAYEHCLDFCRETRLGTKRLIDYQDVQIELADMFLKLLAGRSMVWYSAGHFLPKPMPAVSAATKTFCSDTSVEVCRKAMDIMGEHAYLHGNSVEKALRDARLTQIYEGTNQINRLGIIEDIWDNDIVK